MISCSRGGRNTKILALAEAKGSFIAILLTGGEAHDCRGRAAFRRAKRRSAAHPRSPRLKAIIDDVNSRNPNMRAPGSGFRNRAFVTDRLLQASAERVFERPIWVNLDETRAIPHCLVPQLRMYYMHRTSLFSRRRR